jgi:FKBP-type peptidyl-prolyl cis-trans isomerase 2
MSKKILGIIVAIVIIVSSIAAYWYAQQKEEKGKKGMKVEVGDLVEVNYTGSFVNGTVFDTNIESVANDENISKSYSFKPKSFYSPLKFTVGRGQMIKGFDEGVLNMTVGETKIITVQSGDGYGEKHEDLFITINKTQSVPLYESISSQEFHELYPDEPLEKDVSFKHYFWKWNVTIDDIDGDNVTILNMPDINSTITEVDSGYNGGEGRILLKHFPAGNITIDKKKTEFLAIDNEALNYILEELNKYPSNSSVSDIGIVSDVDGETFIIDYNPEVVGKTLIFEVTIVSISRG